MNCDSRKIGKASVFAGKPLTSGVRVIIKPSGPGAGGFVLPAEPLPPPPHEDIEITIANSKNVNIIFFIVKLPFEFFNITL
jgi:hypothetical protein